MIRALSRAMIARDGLTHRHAERVQRYAVVLARQVGACSDSMIAAIDAAALLHDIGKLGIPDSLLHKPGPLTPEEYDQVKQHAILGAEMLSTVPFDGPLAQIVRHHHENWDGSGYPDGIRHEAIPVGARVLAIVDCYDALTSDRPYRRALSHEQAVEMIDARRGRMYDPVIAEAFLRIVDCLRSAGPDPTRDWRPTRTLWLRDARAV